MSVVMFERTPVTPSEDTQYTKPEASFAIMRMRSCEVGAMSDTRSRPYWRHSGSNSAFSSNGTSGRMRPSMPISAAVRMKRSEPYEYTTFA